MPKDDPESLTLMLYQIVDDQGRKVEFHQDILGALHDVFYNHAFDGNGNRVSYCRTFSYTDAVVGTGGTVGGVMYSDFATHMRLSRLQTHRYNYGPDSQVPYPHWYRKLLSQNDYTYDLNGNRLTNTITDSNNNSRTETYGYDELNRLTSVDYGDGETQTYSFDPMGNRTQKVDNTTTENYTYNNANILVSRGSNNYTNDFDGNTLTGGGRTNTWDSQNRLVSCAYNGNTSTFSYGSDGLRHESSVNNGTSTVTTEFALDGQNVVREMRTISSVLTATVTYFAGLCRIDEINHAIRWYMEDGLGSVLGEVDPSGNITATRSYDVYGASRSVSGTPMSKHGFVGQLGHPSEDNTGLIYMRARYMDPVCGRFVSEDAARDGINWFSYANGNPVGFVDSSGKALIPLNVLCHYMEIFGCAILASCLSFIGHKMMKAGKASITEGVSTMCEGQWAQISAGLFESLLGAPLSAGVESAGKLTEQMGARTLRQGFIQTIQGAFVCMAATAIGTLGADEMTQGFVFQAFGFQ